MHMQELDQFPPFLSALCSNNCIDNLVQSSVLVIHVFLCLSLPLLFGNRACIMMSRSLRHDKHELGKE